MFKIFTYFLGISFAVSSLLLGGCSHSLPAPPTPQAAPSDEYWSAIVSPEGGTIELQGVFTQTGVVMLNMGTHIPKHLRKGPWMPPAALSLIFNDQHCNNQHELTVLQKEGNITYSHYFKQRITWGEVFNLHITWQNSSVTLQLNDEVLSLNNVEPIISAALSQHAPMMQRNNIAYIPQ